MKTMTKMNSKTTLLCFIAILTLGACSSTQSTIHVPANQEVILDYTNYPLFAADIKNQSLSQIDVAVTSKCDQKQIKGFGLPGKAKATVRVEQENQLILRNAGKRSIQLKINIREELPQKVKDQSKYIRFTLSNSGSKSIPLLIPNVMDPNLSPFSKSGVNLKIGQEIFFREGMKKYLLLKVDETIKEGDIIDVNKLLAERRKEIRGK